jgi:hypothetical protein
MLSEIIKQRFGFGGRQKKTRFYPPDIRKRKNYQGPFRQNLVLKV